MIKISNNNQRYEGSTPVPRPKTKEELMLASKENYEKLNRFISQLSEDELQTPFDFSRDQKKLSELEINK